MSETTKAALDAAINAHFADEHGDYVTAWVVVTETTPLAMLDNQDGGIFSVEARDMQSEYLTIGLLHEALHARK